MDANARTWKAKARELRDELDILFWLNREGLMQYDIQQKRACEAEAEVARLREVLGATEAFLVILQTQSMDDPDLNALVDQIAAAIHEQEAILE